MKEIFNSDDMSSISILASDTTSIPPSPLQAGRGEGNPK